LGPKPQSPIPNPQSPIPINIIILLLHIKNSLIKGLFTFYGINL